jgi:hypothetical protein
MGRRFKSSTMRFGVPLSVPGSRHVKRCYGKHGKGFGGCPPRRSNLELVLVNAERTLWTVDGYFPEPHKYVTDAVGLGGDGWKILGWRMADGSMPLGEYDAVDPELAQFDYLPVPNPHDSHAPRSTTPPGPWQDASRDDAAPAEPT